MRVRSLGWEDLLEEGMATHSSILPGEPSWTEEPGELGAMVMENALICGDVCQNLQE